MSATTSASVRLQKGPFAMPVSRPLSSKQLNIRATKSKDLFWRPTSKKDLRSCMHCGIIQESKGFKTGCKNGCFTQDDLLRQQNALELHTTRNYNGTISILEAQANADVARTSWVARYHRIHGVAGCYSLHRVGTVPRRVHDEWQYENTVAIPEEWTLQKQRGVTAKRAVRSERFASSNKYAAEDDKMYERMYGKAVPAAKAAATARIVAEATPEEAAPAQADDYSDVGAQSEQFGEIDHDFEL